MKKLIKAVVSRFGLEIRRIPQEPGIPDLAFYKPLFSPWFLPDFQKYYAIAEPRTVVSPDRCFVLYILLKQALTIDGDIAECGVYRGGTAAMLAKVIAETGGRQKFYLFDTFGGMPKTDKKHDLHNEGDFADTSAEDVEAFVNQPDIAIIRKGFIPETFAGLEARRFAFAHIDVDI